MPVTSVPPSSYRLGVKAANLHQLFPIHVTEALKHSLVTFDKEVFSFPCPSNYYSIVFYKFIQQNYYGHFFNSDSLTFQLPGFICNDALLHGVEVIKIHAIHFGLV